MAIFDNRKVAASVRTDEDFREALTSDVEVIFMQNSDILFLSDEKLSEAVSKVFDLRPSAIIKMLDLRKPQYKALAAYGHMGREDLGVSWEKTDKIQALLDAVN